MLYKVVYNACYGGFSLSNKAINWLEANCTDNELRNHIKAVKVNHETDTSSLKNDFLRYNVSDWFCGKRHHKDLVAVVEALGPKASGSCAKLEIITIDINQYRIDEYDGFEEVITPEDSDWIFIND